MTKEYELAIQLKEATEWTDIFSESYRIALWPQFVSNDAPKEHNFKNHLASFLRQLKKNNHPVVKKPFKKWEIYTVSYGMNTGSEVNGERPSILYKDSKNTLWDDLIAIPLTSVAQEKLADKFDVFVPKDENNKLYQNSYARIRQLRAVSLLRIGKYVGTVTDEYVINAINKSVKEMLAIET